MNQSQLEWYKTENQRLTQQIEQLVRDNHRLTACKQDLQDQLSTLRTSYSIGERGDACVAIDGGNL